jgi:hypothetical protein
VKGVTDPVVSEFRLPEMAVHPVGGELHHVTGLEQFGGRVPYLADAIPTALEGLDQLSGLATGRTKRGACWLKT